MIVTQEPSSSHYCVLNQSKVESVKVHKLFLFASHTFFFNGNRIFILAINFGEFSVPFIFEKWTFIELCFHILNVGIQFLFLSVTRVIIEGAF